jgi:hypothetical protein
MRIASFTMVGQFPHGIDLHVRNLRWALSDEDHIFVVTFGAHIEERGLQGDDRTTYIACGRPQGPRRAYPFWREFPRIVRDLGITPEWYLFMEQDIWFHQPIADDPPPCRDEIRGHVLPDGLYHSVTRDGSPFHPRVWEGSLLLHGALVNRAIDFGVDFSAHAHTFFHRDRESWERQLGGRLSQVEYDRPDTMDELTWYCALVEKTRMTHAPKAVHLQGPEALHRLSPEVYRGSDPEALQALTDRWRYYFCVPTAVAVYFIAGNWEVEADWRGVRRRDRAEFEKILRTAGWWMRPGEYARLEQVVAGF